MNDTSNGRVTWRELYEVLADFRKDVTEQFDGLRRQMRWAITTIVAVAAIAVSILLTVQR